jgi:hypothetical protein
MLHYYDIFSSSELAECRIISKVFTSGSEGFQPILVHDEYLTVCLSTEQITLRYRYEVRSWAPVYCTAALIG